MTVRKLALRNLWRRPIRTLLLVLSIALAVATAQALLALSRGVQDSSRAGNFERGADLSATQRDASDIFSGFVDQTIEDRVRALRGVAGVTGELAMFAPVGQDQDFLVLGWSPKSHFWETVPVASGRAPRSGEHGFVLIGDNVAKALGKHAGDSISLFDKEIPIIAVTGYQAAVNRGLVIMPLADLQELSFRPGQVTVIHIKLEPGLSEERVAAIEKQAEAFGNISVFPTEQMLINDRNIKVFNAVSRAISVIALTMAGLSVLNVLLMAVQERTRETGIMMAIGWSNRRIMATIVLEGAIMGLFGCLAGIPLGFVAGSLFGLLPTIGNYIAFHPSLEVILPSVAGGVALATLGSLFPAWRAVSQSPAEALRRA